MKMKYVLSFLLLVGVSAHANSVDTVFVQDTVLPKELQTQLLSYIKTHCGQYLEPGSLRETQTTVTESVDSMNAQKFEFGTALVSHYSSDPNRQPDLEARFYAETVQINVWDSTPKFEVVHVSVEGKDCLNWRL